MAPANRQSSSLHHIAIFGLCCGMGSSFLSQGTEQPVCFTTRLSMVLSCNRTHRHAALTAEQLNLQCVVSELFSSGSP